MSIILVTGGAGFIGSHISEELAKQGHSIRILDDFSTGKKGNPAGTKIELIKGDIRDIATVKKAMKDVECVFHEAAIASVTKSIEDPILVNSVNVNGTLNVLVSAKDSGCKKVVFASSSSVYGNAAKMPIKESYPVMPLTPYAVTKLVGEQYCKVFFENYGMESVCLRYFNVFGPRQDPNSEYAAVIPKFISLVKKNQSPVIFGNGEQTRDFIFVKDVAQANSMAMGFKGFGIFNVCSGSSVSLTEAAMKIIRIAGKDTKPVYSNPRKGDIMHSIGDPSESREKLKFKAAYTFESGLKETISQFNF